MMKTVNKGLFSAIIGVSAVLLLGTGSVRAGDPIKVGVLTCKTVQGSRVNLLIHSTVDVRCVFDDGTKTEHYKGETGIGLGIDLNIKKDATIAYTVLSATDTKAGSHALAGRYGGAKAAATVGVGVGAAVLVGGGDDNITLQPLALEGSTGLGVEGGATYLYLEADT